MIELKCGCHWEGQKKELVLRRFKDVGDRLSCPRCRGRRVKLKQPPLTRDNVFTTAPKTARHYGLNLLENMGLDRKLYVFTDASSSGTYASIQVDRRGRHRPRITVRVNDPPPTPARNVPAEVAGVALAVKHAPEGSNVTVVSDFLGTALWLTGEWGLGCQWSAPRVLVAVHLIRQRRLKVTFVHHGGHQRDPSEFTYWNNRVDGVCGDRKNRMAGKCSDKKRKAAAQNARKPK